MKKPDEVIGSLSPHEAKQVAELVSGAERTLAHEAAVTFDVSETRATILERVWDHVIAQANAAGWLAEAKGATVTIRRPPNGSRTSR